MAVVECAAQIYDYLCRARLHGLLQQSVCLKFIINVDDVAQVVHHTSHGGHIYLSANVDGGSHIVIVHNVCAISNNIISSISRIIPKCVVEFDIAGLQVEGTDFPQLYLIDLHRLSVTIYLRYGDSETQLVRLIVVTNDVGSKHSCILYYMLIHLVAILIKAAYLQGIEKVYSKNGLLHFYYESHMYALLGICLTAVVNQVTAVNLLYLLHAHDHTIAAKQLQSACILCTVGDVAVDDITGICHIAYGEYIGTRLSVAVITESIDGVAAVHINQRMVGHGLLFPGRGAVMYGHDFIASVLCRGSELILALCVHALHETVCSDSTGVVVVRRLTFYAPCDGDVWIRLQLISALAVAQVGVTARVYRTLMVYFWLRAHEGVIHVVAATGEKFHAGDELYLGTGEVGISYEVCCHVAARSEPQVEHAGRHRGALHLVAVDVV